MGAVAHSVTLAALDAVALSGRVFEPLTAASIDFAGVESIVRREEPEWPGRFHNLQFLAGSV